MQGFHLVLHDMYPLVLVCMSLCFLKILWLPLISKEYKVDSEYLVEGISTRLDRRFLVVVADFLMEVDHHLNHERVLQRLVEGLLLPLLSTYIVLLGL